jgi:hypothetical protein
MVVEYRVRVTQKIELIDTAEAGPTDIYPGSEISVWYSSTSPASIVLWNEGARPRFGWVTNDELDTCTANRVVVQPVDSAYPPVLHEAHADGRAA